MTFWTNYRVKLSKTKAVLDYFRKSIQSQELSFDGQRLVNIYRGGGGGRGGGVGRFGFVTIKFTNHPPARGWSPLTVLRVSLQTLH